jgi:hypothetical protein
LRIFLVAAFQFQDLYGCAVCHRLFPSLKPNPTEGTIAFLFHLQSRAQCHDEGNRRVDFIFLDLLDRLDVLGEIVFASAVRNLPRNAVAAVVMNPVLQDERLEFFRGR